MTRPVLTVDLAAVVANWRALSARLAPPARAASVVKADAYGLGLAPVATALASAGCETFFVATLEEGIALREVLPKARILVLEGLDRPSGPAFREARLVPVLNDPGQVAAWDRFAHGAGSRLPAALHVDTGMNRLGLDQAEARALAKAWPRGISLELVMSHLACAEDGMAAMNATQAERFAEIRALFPGIPGSLANSGGIFLGSGYHHDMVRPGIALYGGNPVEAAPNPMEPVVSLTAPILQVRQIDAAGTVGYGAARRVDPGSRLAVVALGYADGLLRSLGAGDGQAGGHGLIDGRPALIVGRVSMDLVTLDVSNLRETAVQQGASVTFLGGELTIDRVAAAAGTISYEILTRLGPRVERRYVGGKAA